MNLKSIDLTNYRDEQCPADIFIHQFIEVLLELTSCQGANTVSDTKYEHNIIFNLLFRYGYSLSKSPTNQNLSFIVGGDMRKFLSVSQVLDKDIIDSYNRIRYKGKKVLRFKDNCADISLSPDIVIHASNAFSSNQQEDQHLILEAKTTTNLCKTHFFWDFFKLNVYKEKLNFRHLIYFIYGSDKTKVERFLANYQNNRYYNAHCEDIIFVIQPKLTEDVCVYKIENNS